MTSLHVICGLGPSQSKILAKPKQLSNMTYLNCVFWVTLQNQFFVYKINNIQNICFVYLQHNYNHSARTVTEGEPGASPAGGGGGGGRGGNAPRFSFLHPPDLFLAPRTVFFWEEKVAFFGRKKTLKFRPEKAFGNWRKTLPPDFNFAPPNLAKLATPLGRTCLL